MTFRKNFDIQVFTCQGGNYVTSKELTSNIATLTTLINHGYQVGDTVWIGGIDATFNSPYSGPTTITDTPTSTTFSYAKAAGNVSPTAVEPYGNIFKAQYWTKPASAVMIKFTLCGAGGGGGSGARQATTSNRTGGGGGGGGGWAEIVVPASQVPDSAITVLVPNGGYGGLPTSSDNSTGMSGQRGGSSSYNTAVRKTNYGDNGDFSYYAACGSGGTGGGTGTTASGGSGGVNTQYVGGSGGNGTITTGGMGANATYVGSGGGGGGGAAANSTTAAAGSTSATIFAVRSLSGIQVSPGNGTSTMDATTNTSYYIVHDGMPGIGGGGGAYKTATNGGNASDAVNYCAGGGGGGASDNGYNSGAGGKGADGCVVITTYF